MLATAARGERLRAAARRAAPVPSAAAPPLRQLHDAGQGSPAAAWGERLADPAAEPPTLLERLQDMCRPAFAAGHAYRYAETSARAQLAEQLESGRGKPTVEAMCVRGEAEACCTWR